MGERSAPQQYVIGCHRDDVGTRPKRHHTRLRFSHPLSRTEWPEPERVEISLQ
jgi:hypothetical protein